MPDPEPPSTSTDTDPGPGAAPEQRSWLRRLADLFGSEVQDREALREVLREAHLTGLVDQQSLRMLGGVLAMSEMNVRDVMIPRAQMVVVERDARPSEILPVITESGHSRFPVIVDDKDEVVGILLAKDLLRHLGGSDEDFDISECLRPAVRIPESKPLDALLHEFRANRNHMAIVVDEFGGTAGVVTIEDVLEEIVGEIDDEHDIDEEDTITRDGEGRWVVQALTPVSEFNEHFGCGFSDEEYDTVGGLVLGELGHLPKRGERLRLGDFDVRVLRADGRRVESLLISRRHRPGPGGADAA